MSDSDVFAAGDKADPRAFNPCVAHGPPARQSPDRSPAAPPACVSAAHRRRARALSAHWANEWSFETSPSQAAAPGRYGEAAREAGLPLRPLRRLRPCCAPAADTRIGLVLSCQRPRSPEEGPPATPGFACSAPSGPGHCSPCVASRPAPQFGGGISAWGDIDAENLTISNCSAGWVRAQRNEAVGSSTPPGWRRVEGSRSAVLCCAQL